MAIVGAVAVGVVVVAVSADAAAAVVSRRPFWCCPWVDPVVSVGQSFYLDAFCFQGAPERYIYVYIYIWRKRLGAICW